MLRVLRLLVGTKRTQIEELNREAAIVERENAKMQVSTEAVIMTLGD